MFCFAVMVLIFCTSPSLSDSSKYFNSLQEFASLPKERVTKVTYVEGDMAKAGLGLSTEHRGLVMSSHISIVFHVAASVSFQDNLLETMQTNAWPAIEVVRLCQAMPDVEVKKAGNVCAPKNL
jgi:thioester reductase-like protein